MANEFHAVRAVGWRPRLPRLTVSDVAMLLGSFAGGPARESRQVVALGTANRNIALALLVALESFPESPVIPAVVANGLVLILLGLVHVGWWRFFAPAAAAA